TIYVAGRACSAKLRGIFRLTILVNAASHASTDWRPRAVTAPFVRRFPQPRGPANSAAPAPRAVLREVCRERRPVAAPAPVATADRKAPARPIPATHSDGVRSLRLPGRANVPGARHVCRCAVCGSRPADYWPAPDPARAYAGHSGAI